MTPIIIANWKMHFTLEETNAFCNKLVGTQRDNLIIAPPIPYIALLAATFPKINFCAQNLSSFAEEGAYTGEYSSKMIKSCGINHAIIGHSERRTLFKETDELIAAKVNASLDAEVTPIICIGESIQVRQSGNYVQFLIDQLKASLPTATDDDIIIAYEPVWSIGTNQIPTEQQLIETFQAINSYLEQSKVAKNVRLLYGGSVNSDNIEMIRDLDHVSGVLVGKSSLDLGILIKMLERL